MVCVRGVAGRAVRVMRRSLGVFLVVMLGRFAVVAGGMFMMFGGFDVMFAGRMFGRHVRFLRSELCPHRSSQQHDQDGSMSETCQQQQGGSPHARPPVMSLS